MTYQPGIPTGSVPLNQDFVNIQNNFTQINDQFLVDHVPLTSTSVSPPNGYHTVVHLAANSFIADNPPNNYPIIPPTAAGFTGEVFTTQSNDGINGDEMLWYQSGGGRLIQITRNFVPTTSNNTNNAPSGSTFMLGGLIFKWGTISAVSETATPILFTSLGVTQFPNNCFSIVANLNGGTSSANLNVSNISALGFTYYNTSGTTRTFFWWAIGN